MKELRFWELIEDRLLNGVPRSQINVEKHLEDWLEHDISVLDTNLLVIGR